MKILYLTPGCFDKGGISRYSRYQIRALQDIYGVESIRTISMLGPGEDQFEDQFDVHWHGNGNSVASKIPFVSQSLALAIKGKPDVLHAAHINYGGLINALCRIGSSRTILNVYGVEVWSDPSWHAQYGLRKADRIISDCHNTAEYVARVYRGGVTPEVIWDCVDLTRFRYNDARFNEIARKYQLPPKDKFIILLTLGRLSEDAAYKGYERLIDVFSRVHHSFPNLRLVIAGKGNLVPSLQAQATRLGIQDAVVFTGSIAEEDMPSIYSYADIFSLVTEAGKGMGEGLPLTPLEAMACRTPIIVGNQDGSREAVFGEENGFVIDPHDLNRHAEVILKILRDKDACALMSRNAESLARQYFSFDHFREKHYHFYESIRISAINT